MSQIKSCNNCLNFIDENDPDAIADSMGWVVSTGELFFYGFLAFILVIDWLQLTFNAKHFWQ